MTATITRHGQCLCGAVTITATQQGHSVGACHCTMCRRWGGGPLLAMDCGSDVSFSGEQHISVYSSSDWAERGFCRHCGTHLFYRLKQETSYAMPAGLFAETDDLMFDHQVCVDTQPGYYQFANQTKNLTCEELFALYAPPAS